MMPKDLLKHLESGDQTMKDLTEKRTPVVESPVPDINQATLSGWGNNPWVGGNVHSQFQALQNQIQNQLQNQNVQMAQSGLAGTRQGSIVYIDEMGRNI